MFNTISLSNTQSKSIFTLNKTTISFVLIIMIVFLSIYTTYLTQSIVMFSYIFLFAKTLHTHTSYLDKLNNNEITKETFKNLRKQTFKKADFLFKNFLFLIFGLLVGNFTYIYMLIEKYEPFLTEVTTFIR